MKIEKNLDNILSHMTKARALSNINSAYLGFRTIPITLLHACLEVRTILV